MVRHTPGPWTVQENGGPEDGYNVLDDRNRYIAFVDTSGEMISDEQAHANARLIAEAPAMHDLLFQLEPFARLHSDLAGHKTGREPLDQVRALLARLDDPPA